MSINREQHDHEWRIENTKQGVEYAREGIRTLVLMNGGAIVALLTLSGATSSKDSAVNLIRLYVKYSIGSFTGGLVSAAICFIFAYVAQLHFAGRIDNNTLKPEKIRNIGLLLAIISILLFLAGAWFALCAIPETTDAPKIN